VAPEWTTKQWVLSHCLIVGILTLVLFQYFAVMHHPLRVSVLDVGQGDAILIQTPEYKNILIDAGSDSKVVDELGKQIAFFDKTIDLFILTHPHQDHVGGILDVMQKYQIKQVMITGVASGNPTYLAFLDVIKAHSIPILFPKHTKDIQVGKNVFLDVIFPFESQGFLGQKADNLNNTSIVTRLVKKEAGELNPLMMLTGDAEKEEETEIVLTGQSLDSTILKLGHHGSRTATSDGFLWAVSPQAAIISAGRDNTFNHPHEETMEKVKDLDVRNTIEEGMVVFEF